MTGSNLYEKVINTFGNSINAVNEFCEAIIGDNNLEVKYMEVYKTPFSFFYRDEVAKAIAVAKEAAQRWLDACGPDVVAPLDADAKYLNVFWDEWIKTKQTIIA